MTTTQTASLTEAATIINATVAKAIANKWGISFDTLTKVTTSESALKVTAARYLAGLDAGKPRAYAAADAAEALMRQLAATVNRVNNL